jgi:hypothetical protein
LLNTEGNSLKDFFKDSFSSRSARRFHFWISYTVAGFQPFFVKDGDPDNETGWYGVTMPNNDESVIFLETSRDIGESKKWTPAEVKFKRGKTIAHEFGHQWRLLESSGGIMTGGDGKGTSGDVKNRSPLLRYQIKLIRRKPTGPGPGP